MGPKKFELVAGDFLFSQMILVYIFTLKKKTEQKNIGSTIWWKISPAQTIFALKMYELSWLRIKYDIAVMNYASFSHPFPPLRGWHLDRKFTDICLKLLSYWRHKREIHKLKKKT